MVDAPVCLCVTGESRWEQGGGSCGRGVAPLGGLMLAGGMG